MILPPSRLYVLKPGARNPLPSFLDAPIVRIRGAFRLRDFPPVPRGLGFRLAMAIREKHPQGFQAMTFVYAIAMTDLNG
jgi:hypothetical protein